MQKDANGESRNLVLKNFGDLINSRSQGPSVTVCESRKQSPICRSWVQGLGLPMDSSRGPCKKQKTSQENPEKSLQKVSWNPKKKTKKSICTDNFLGIRQSLWRSFLGIIARLHHTNRRTNGIAETSSAPE